jgi:hypothetical protein
MITRGNFLKTGSTMMASASLCPQLCFGPDKAQWQSDFYPYDLKQTN